MESLEVSAKTVEEATQLALQKLGLNLDQVEVTVLKKGRSRILGLGGEEAKILVKPIAIAPPQPALAADAAADAPQIAKQVLEELLAAMMISATVNVAQPPAPAASDQAIALDIQGEDLGVLIGRRGQTLASLQYIVNLVVTHRVKSRLGVPVSLDVNSYKQRRYQALQALALRLAEQVKTTGRPMAMEPMPPNERRIVHLALADSLDVVTQSTGEGEARKVTIMPKGKNK